MTDSEYHCENCPNHEISPLDDSCPGDDICGVNGCTIHPITMSWIEIHGCSLHPSAQAALRAEGAKQERELMLIPLITWLRKKRKYYGTCSGSNANDDPEDCDPYNTVLLKIESLRQSQSTGGERK